MNTSRPGAHGSCLSGLQRRPRRCRSLGVPRRQPAHPGADEDHWRSYAHLGDQLRFAAIGGRDAARRGPRSGESAASGLAPLVCTPSVFISLATRGSTQAGPDDQALSARALALHPPAARVCRAAVRGIQAHTPCSAGAIPRNPHDKARSPDETGTAPTTTRGATDDRSKPRRRGADPARPPKSRPWGARRGRPASTAGASCRPPRPSAPPP